MRQLAKTPELEQRRVQKRTKRAQYRRVEQALQMSVAEFLDLALPPGCGVEWTAFIANDATRLAGAIHNGMGLKKGWPDLQFVFERRYYGVELKAPGGSLSADQDRLIARLRAQGCFVEVAETIEDVEVALRGWGMPLRGTLGKFLPETAKQRAKT